MAIDTITTMGNVSIDGSGTATATAGDVGIWAGTTAGGSVTIQDFDTVTSVDTGLFTYGAGGDITITGMGTGGGSHQPRLTAFMPAPSRAMATW